MEKCSLVRVAQVGQKYLMPHEPDEVPGNKHVLTNNQEKEKKYKVQKGQLEDFKARRKQTPPLSSTG